MTTFYIQGYVAAGTIDVGGYFGLPHASIGNLPFTVTWNGVDCNCYDNPITGAVMTVNGVSFDIAQQGILRSEWIDAGPPLDLPAGDIQVFTSLGSILSTSTLDGVGLHGGGFFRLEGSGLGDTTADLAIYHAGLQLVPAPVVAAGLPGLVAGLVLALLWRRNR